MLLCVVWPLEKFATNIIIAVNAIAAVLKLLEVSVSFLRGPTAFDWLYFNNFDCYVN